MKTQFSRVMKRCVGGAVLAATLGVAPAGVAQIALVEGGSVTMPQVPNLPSLLSPLYGASELDTTTVDYQDGDYHFRVTSSVFSGVASPFGPGSDKLIFAYRILNLSAPLIASHYDSQNQEILRKWGITSFAVSGFQGVQTAVAEVIEPGVDPGQVGRSGGVVTFNYPPVVPSGEAAPPIYAGENSRTLLVFTDATAFSSVTSTVTNTDVDYAGTTTEVVMGVPLQQSVTVFAPSSVPDSASTSGMIGLALVLLAAGFRMRASSLR
jgi:hypothetical protein